jgi:hypothetical protein
MLGQSWTLCCKGLLLAPLPLLALPNGMQCHSPRPAQLLETRHDPVHIAVMTIKTTFQ